MEHVVDQTSKAAGTPRAPPRFADSAQAVAAAHAFDLRQLPGDYYANPYPTYHALRDAGPVHRLPDGGYFLSGYAACVAVYKDCQGLLLRQEARVRTQVRRRTAVRAPHDQPGLQRSAAAHARAQDHRRRLHAALDPRHGAAGDRAGRRPARCHRSQGLGRPDRRSGRRRADRGDRQPAGGAARGARAAARMVAGHPRRAGAGADAGAAGARRDGGRGISWPT